MAEFLLKNQSELTGMSFLWLLILAAALEHVWPKRVIETPIWRRWLANAGMHLVNGICAWLLIPIAGIGLAALCQQHGWGLFNIVSAPTWLNVLISLVALDFSRYMRHLAMHRVPALWRAHRSHHTDMSVDFTTSLRFHPIESLSAIGVTFAAIALFGISAHVVVLNTVITTFTSLVTHTNIAIPERVDRILRLVFITPDMHRVHHSNDAHEKECNFGNLLPWWDRLFGTYIAQPRLGHSKMQLGLPEFQDAKYGKLSWMLWMPFLPLSSARQADIKSTRKT